MFVSICLMLIRYLHSFSSVFGLHHLLSSSSLAVKCSAVFSSVTARTKHTFGSTLWPLNNTTINQNYESLEAWTKWKKDGGSLGQPQPEFPFLN